MPLDLDFLTEIVNVHWGGGGVYVAGSQWFFTNPTSDVWTNEIVSTEDDLTKWRKTISTPHGGGFMSSAMRGSAVAAFTGADKDKPMFVVGGLADQIETGGQGAAMMATSSNGVDWSPHTLASFGQVYLLTWNEVQRAFYAGMWDYSEQLVNPDGLIFDVALRSVDGLDWTEIARTSTAGDYIAPVEQFCSDKVTDVRGHKVPTSIFGYDETNDILITPDPLSMIFSFFVPDDDQHGNQLKITRGPDNDHPGSAIIALPRGMDRVWAVAYAAGIWQAAGEAAAQGIVATSIDDGKTWTITLRDVAGSAFANIAALDQTDSGNAGL